MKNVAIGCDGTYVLKWNPNNKFLNANNSMLLWTTHQIIINYIYSSNDILEMKHVTFNSIHFFNFDWTYLEILDPKVPLYSFY